MQKPNDQISSASEQIKHKEQLEHVKASIREADEVTKKNIAIQIKQEFLNNAPRTNKELWDAVKVLFDVRIPWRSTRDGFQAPFEWFSDIYFGRAEQSVGLAARGGGKTYTGSILQWMMMTYRDGWEARHAAANRAQSKVTQKNLYRFARDPVLRTVFKRGEVHKQEAWWNNFSNWEIVTGSIGGVSGQHPNSLFMDEIEFWDVDALEQSWAVPIARDGYLKVWAAFSTRQRSFGAMNWLVENAKKKDVKLYTWTAFETMQPCKECYAIAGAKHGTFEEKMSICNLWEDCHGERGIKSTGWIERKEVMKLKASMELQSWKTQGLCEKPSSSGLVLMNFEHAPKMQGGNYTYWRYQEELDGGAWFAVHDPAEGKKSVIYFIQVMDGATYIFDELIQNPCPNVATAKKAFIEKISKQGLPDPRIIIVDPHRPDAVADWRSSDVGGKTFYADVPPTDMASGGTQLIDKTLEILRKAILDGDGRRRFFVNPVTCTGAIKGIQEYHYPTDMNGVVTSDRPDKEYSDEIDPMRYWELWKATKYRDGRWKAFWA